METREVCEEDEWREGRVEEQVEDILCRDAVPLDTSDATPIDDTKLYVQYNSTESYTRMSCLYLC